MTDSVTESPGIITQRLDEQGRIQPGTEGWWQVWGARAQHVRAGDMVMVKWTGKDGEPDRYGEYEIAEQLSFDPVCPRFRATNGDTFRIGALQPIVLLRRGTKHTLA